MSSSRAWTGTVLLLAFIALPASAQPKDQVGSKAAPSLARIVYRGTYDVIVSAPARPIRRVTTRSVVNAIAGPPGRRKQGNLEFTLDFNSGNVTALLSVDGGAVSTLTGTVRDGICTLSGGEGDEIHRGRCDAASFAGTISAPAKSRMPANGTFRTSSVQVASQPPASRPATGSKASRTGRSMVSMEETRAMVAEGGEGSRPGGANSWLTIMPPGFGKYFPPPVQAAALQRAAERVLVDDLENYAGATLVPGSFSEPSFYRSASAPGETWVRLNYKYRSAFGLEDGWVESRLISGQVACVRHHHESVCNPPKASIADQRASLSRFTPRLGPIVIPASCVQTERIEGTPAYRPVIGNYPDTSPIYGELRGGSPSYTKRTYTCPTRQFVLECRWGRFEPTLRRNEEMGLFDEQASNAAIARGDCVRTK